MAPYCALMLTRLISSVQAVMETVSTSYSSDGVRVPVDTGGGFCDVEFSRVYLGEFDYVVCGYLGCREW